MLGDLVAAVEALEALDVDGMSDDDLGCLLVELRRLENRIDGAATR